METFFFISLGITFVLILLLVYHFKQRLTFVEQKSDNMFDIINNMVKEMGVIKTLVITYMNSQNTVVENREPFQQQFRQNIVLTPSTHETDITLDTLPVEHLMVHEEDEEDDEEDEDEEDEEEDEEDEDDDEEEEEDHVNITKPFIEPIDETKIAVSDDECDPETEVIELETTVIETTDNEIVLVESKLEEEIHTLETASAEETHIQEVVQETDKKEDYSKYNLAQLKDLVVEKGLSKDASKMKKSKLLELLSSTA
jgi:hypothetical protein